MCRKDEEIFHLRMLLYEFKVMSKISTRKLGTNTSLDHSSFITVLILFLKEFNVSHFFTDWGRRFHSLGAEHKNAPL